MWTPTTREKYCRCASRYQSDVTGAGWGVIEPHLPEPKTRGRPRGRPLREIINAIYYVMRSGFFTGILCTKGDVSYPLKLVERGSSARLSSRGDSR